MRELVELQDIRKEAVRPIAVGEAITPAPAWLHRSLDSLWEEMIRKASDIPQTGFASLEKEFREKLLKLGANLLGEALPYVLGTGREGQRIACPACGAQARFIENRPRTITTLVQEIRLQRAYYHCPKCGKGEVPLDRLLSLHGTSFSPGVREAICLLDAEIPFDRGSELLRRLSAIRLDKQEGRRLAEGLGKELEKQTVEELDNVWRPKKPIPRELSQAPARLYFSPDGTMVNIQGDWKEAKVGTVFTTQIPKRREEPQREETRYVATMRDADDLGKRMYVEALKLGLSDKTRVVIVADGAHWIWTWAENSLPKERVEIVDFYHASEKLWELSRSVFGEENPKGQGWARRWSRKLYDADARAAISAMRRLRPRSKEGRECLRKTLGYFHYHRRRMCYRDWRRQGYFIGSGITESSCKRLVGARFKQAGMRWTREGVQSILQLRLAVLNNRWDYLWGTGCRETA